MMLVDALVGQAPSTEWIISMPCVNATEASSDGGSLFGRKPQPPLCTRSALNYWLIIFHYACCNDKLRWRRMASEGVVKCGQYAMLHCTKRGKVFENWWINYYASREAFSQRAKGNLCTGSRKVCNRVRLQVVMIVRKRKHQILIEKFVWEL